MLPSELSGSDAREAIRALAGRTLRTEVYALDGSADEDKPYTVAEPFRAHAMNAPRDLNVI